MSNLADTSRSAHVDDRSARRNAFILSGAQMLYGGSATITFATGGLIGLELAENKALATLPITAYVLGTACATIPASMYMNRVGRRVGFMTGAFFGLAAAVLAVLALYRADFWLFSGATLLTGIYQAFAAYYRFAAADVASDGFKAKAISWVLAGGVAAAFVGPQLVIWTRSALAPVMFAGVYVSSAVLALVAFFLLSFVQIPLPQKATSTRPERPLGTIMRQPLFVVAVVCGMVSYAIMNLVMTATPLAMVDHNLTVDDAAFVIQWHVVAMFAPSFFTGSIINRFGVVRVILTGLILLAVSGAISLSGTAFAHFGLALVALGLGWNFSFIGATTLVTATYRPHEQAKVQAANDFMVFGLVAFASLSSGILLQLFGWSMVNIALFPFVLIAVVMVVWLGRNQHYLRAHITADE